MAKANVEACGLKASTDLIFGVILYIFAKNAATSLLSLKNVILQKTVKVKFVWNIEICLAIHTKAVYFILQMIFADGPIDPEVDRLKRVYLVYSSITSQVGHLFGDVNSVFIRESEQKRSNLVGKVVQSKLSPFRGVIFTTIGHTFLWYCPPLSSQSLRHLENSCLCDIHLLFITFLSVLPPSEIVLKKYQVILQHRGENLNPNLTCLLFT